MIDKDFAGALLARDLHTLQMVTTLLKLVPLVAIGALGLLHVNWSYFAPTIPEGYPSLFSAIVGATTLTLVSYLGIESATVAAGGVMDPTRIIPRATVIGTLFVAAVYILRPIGDLGALPASVLAASPAPYADAASAMWCNWAYVFVTVGAIISGFGALNGFSLLQGQVLWRPAWTGCFRVASQRCRSPALTQVRYAGTGDPVELWLRNPRGSSTPSPLVTSHVSPRCAFVTDLCSRVATVAAEQPRQTGLAARAFPTQPNPNQVQQKW